MAHDGTGTARIPQGELYDFLVGWVPSAVSDAVGFALDLEGMKLQDGDLMVDFAWSTECDPAGWADAPKWLKKNLTDEREES